jgi:hypothetical protein
VSSRVFSESVSWAIDAYGWRPYGRSSFIVVRARGFSQRVFGKSGRISSPGMADTLERPYGKDIDPAAKTVCHEPTDDVMLSW